MIKISPSILAAKDRISSIKKINDTSAEYIHVDSMDGIFVPNTQLGIKEIIHLEKYAKKPLDIHLMRENPKPYIEALKDKNIAYITFHLEINKNIIELIQLIKSFGYKVGISIKPNTKVEELIPYINLIDLVLIMSVEPGFGGQSFIPASLEKADEVRKLSKTVTIEIDGGIKDTNIKEIKKHVDIAVVGSFITNSTNYKETINILKN